MNLVGWKQFKMDELFLSFERGKVHSQYTLPDGDDFFYVGAKKDRCGVMRPCGYDEDLVSKGNCIVFICNGEGSVGYCNYMDRDFMASGDLILAYGDFLNPYTALFIVTLLDRERPKYSFGRKYGKYVKKTTIPLHVIDGGDDPDWAWIENFAKEHLICELPNYANKVWNGDYDKTPINVTPIHLSDRNWEWFPYDELFTISGSSTTPKDYLEQTGSGVYPYVTTQAVNNGVEDFYDFWTESGGVLTVDSAVLGFCSYQSMKFSASDHVEKLTPKYAMNKYIAMFFVTLINKEQYRYSYGRKCSQTKLHSSKIRLPVVPNTKTPDWQFMENYIKSLPYSKNI